MFAKKLPLKLLLSVVTTITMSHIILADERIRVAGSSTVFPFTSAVAEQFTQKTGHPAPVIESTGTGGGFKIFCSGIGDNTTDMTNASRQIKSSEKETCAKNNVTPVEMSIGKDGIVLAMSKKFGQYNFGVVDIYRALAAKINVNGKLVDNPYKTWKEVNPELPDIAIKVMGPPPSSGTRDAFVSLVLEGGAAKDSFMAAMKEKDKKKWKAAVHGLREDGGYIEASEHDNLIVKKLTSDTELTGIFGFSFYEQNIDKLNAATIDGVAPSLSSIGTGEYPVARKLYVYIKKEHVATKPQIKDFIREYLSEEASGSEGYLSDESLIPLMLTDKAMSNVDAYALLK